MVTRKLIYSYQIMILNSEFILGRMDLSKIKSIVTAFTECNEGLYSMNGSGNILFCFIESSVVKLVQTIRE